MLFTEVVSLVEELESLGVRFNLTPRLDGSVRLNCWRLPSAWEHRDRINRLLSERIGNSAENEAQIARFIESRQAVRSSAAA